MYDRLVSNNPPDIGGQLFARTRRAARNAQRLRTKSILFLRIEQAAEEICRRLGLLEGSEEWRAKRYEQRTALLAGIFDPRYWKKCALISESFFTSTPTSIPDPSPPPYSFRIVSNLPTIPTYPPGVADSGPAGYAGSKVGDYFEDQSLSWLESLFELVSATRSTKDEPTFFKWSPRLDIESTTRGSRPMLSLLVRADLVEWDSPIITDHDAPVSAPISFYWRYNVPQTLPPYFQAEKDRDIVGFVPDASTPDTTPVPTTAVLKSAPRPMFGRGFNNNDDVAASISNDARPELWQLKPCLGQKSYIVSLDGSFRLLDYTTGAWIDNSAVASVKDISIVPDGILAYLTDGTFRLRNRKGADLGAWTPPALGTIQAVSLCPSGASHSVFISYYSGGYIQRLMRVSATGQIIGGLVDVASWSCAWRADRLFFTGPAFVRGTLWPVGQISWSNRDHEAFSICNLPGPIPGDIINKNVSFGKYAACDSGIFLIDNANRLLHVDWPAPGAPVDCALGGPPEYSGGAILATGLNPLAKIAATPDGCYFFDGSANARMYDETGAYETLPPPSPWYSFSPSATCFSPAYP